MFIDAFTCCVGPVYASYLKRSLPVWMNTLDSLTVVTSPEDRDTLEVCKPYPRLRVVTSTLFKAYGAHFNKGAALTQAYAAMRPVDWALHFDSDILPETTWRARAERALIPGSIHGARRYDEQGRPIEDKGPWPYGYFQLWHSEDPACQFWPLFEPWHPHAGSYDLEFLEKWPANRWRDLGFRVTHFGEVRQNWFGVGLPEEEQEAAFQKMHQVHKVGLSHTRKLARRAENRLRVPDFSLKFCIRPDKRDPRRLAALVRACMTDDPFLVSVTVAPRKDGCRVLDAGYNPHQLADLVMQTYSQRSHATAVHQPALPS